MKSLKRQGGWFACRAASRRYISITVSSNQADYNLFTAAGSPARPAYILLTINAGVTVYGNTGGLPAIRTAGFAGSSLLRIINNGAIKGYGGSGGNGGTANTPDNNPTLASGKTGTAGGDAIDVQINTVIENASGSIFGGGGGGGGGAGTYSSNPIVVVVDGGGGGGGRGFVASSQGLKGGTGASDGNAGGDAGAGSGGAGEIGSGGETGGSGATGGDWGTDGGLGGDASGGGGSAGPGGAAGYAVRKNGFTVTFDSGNDATHVKGLVA